MAELALNSLSTPKEQSDVGVFPFCIGFFFASRVAVTYIAFQDEPATGTLITIVLSLCIFGVAVLQQLLRADRTHQTPATVRWVFAYLALSASSLLWTTTDSLTVAFSYWAAMAADTVAVILLLRNANANETSEQLLKGFLAASVLVAILAWSIPTMIDLRIGDEDSLHPNAIGYVFALAALFALYLGRTSRLWAMAGLFCGVTLFRTFSKACIVGFVIGAAYYLIHDVRMKRKVKVALAILTVVVITCSWALIEAYVDVYDQSSQVETLTGRTVIWAEAIDAAIHKPWLGYGFYSFRFVIPPFWTFEAWQAHNEILQQFFCYGVAGVIVFIALYFSLWKTIRSHRYSPYTPLATAVLIFALVRGLTDTERFDLTYPLWLIALMSTVVSTVNRETTS